MYIGLNRYRRRKSRKLQTPALENTTRDYGQQTTNPPHSRSQENQSSSTTTSNALVRSSTPLLLVVASAALCSFSSLYFLPNASMTSF
jgi:hypothetical protein